MPSSSPFNPNPQTGKESQQQTNKKTSPLKLRLLWASGRGPAPTEALPPCPLTSPPQPASLPTCLPPAHLPPCPPASPPTCLPAHRTCWPSAAPGPGPTSLCGTALSLCSPRSARTSWKLPECAGAKSPSQFYSASLGLTFLNSSINRYEAQHYLCKACREQHQTCFRGETKTFQKRPVGPQSALLYPECKPIGYGVRPSFCSWKFGGRKGCGVYHPPNTHTHPLSLFICRIVRGKIVKRFRWFAMGI